MEGVLKVGIGISPEMGVGIGVQGKFQPKAGVSTLEKYNTAYERCTWKWLRVLT